MLTGFCRRRPWVLARTSARKVGQLTLIFGPSSLPVKELLCRKLDDRQEKRAGTVAALWGARRVLARRGRRPGHEGSSQVGDVTRSSVRGSTSVGVA